MATAEEKAMKIMEEIAHSLSMGIPALSEEDYHRCEVVCSLLQEEMELKNGTGFLTFRETERKAKALLSRYDLKESYQDLSNLHYVSSLRTGLKPIEQFYTVMDVLSSPDHYLVDSVNVPKRLTNLAPYYLAHEFHHVFKERNPKEYFYMLRYADVIPQFFELIAGENPQDEKDLIHNRLAFMQQSFLSLQDHYDRPEPNILFDVIDSKFCQYINSFYFSVLLYGIYSERPKQLLQAIRNVLVGENTTSELLEHFHCFDSHLDSYVENGIQYLKKYSS